MTSISKKSIKKILEIQMHTGLYSDIDWKNLDYFEIKDDGTVVGIDIFGKETNYKFSIVAVRINE